MKYVLSLLLNNANKTIDETWAMSKAEAVQEFKDKHPQLNLDDTGYSKNGDTSYVVSETSTSFCTR
jgi:hypothetical protein